MQMIEVKELPTEAPDFPEVVVNGRAIEAHSILQEMQYYPSDSLDISRHQAAQALVVRELLMQRADELGLELAPQQPDEPDDEALIRQLLEQEVELPQADETTCQRYYEANPERFKTSPLVAVSHILLGADPADPEERAQRKAEAEGVIEKLQQAPDNFARLAQQCSDCPSKEVGGQLGQLDKGQTVAEFERQVFSLPEGLAARPVESRYGFHVVRIDKRVDGELLPYDMVASRIRSYLQARNYRRAVNQYIQLLVGSAEIEGIEIQAADGLLVQ
ncbi:peptidylprolyl isomerase [Marinobacterium arenosum]|uniref:peptidylprolyl isomerase n=1 Tax=Marinobacterium arenosum TaxID=2862496 RepID=UPI001C948377|nr:peptidylprolyl isomerase [Marinobacterium arenosum]MBY4676376.1 peptidylprolyl isomerase [Marinobacterium arenosum]